MDLDINHSNIHIDHGSLTVEHTQEISNLSFDSYHAGHVKVIDRDGKLRVWVDPAYKESIAFKLKLADFTKCYITLDQGVVTAYSVCKWTHITVHNGVINLDIANRALGRVIMKVQEGVITQNAPLGNDKVLAGTGLELGFDGAKGGYVTTLQMDNGTLTLNVY